MEETDFQYLGQGRDSIGHDFLLADLDVEERLICRLGISVRGAFTCMHGICRAWSWGFVFLDGPVIR